LNTSLNKLNLSLSVLAHFNFIASCHRKWKLVPGTAEERGPNSAAALDFVRKESLTSRVKAAIIVFMRGM